MHEGQPEAFEASPSEELKTVLEYDWHKDLQEELEEIRKVKGEERLGEKYDSLHRYYIRDWMREVRAVINDRQISPDDLRQSDLKEAVMARALILSERFDEMETAGELAELVGADIFDPRLQERIKASIPSYFDQVHNIRLIYPLRNTMETFGITGEEERKIAEEAIKRCLLKESLIEKNLEKAGVISSTFELPQELTHYVSDTKSVTSFSEKFGVTTFEEVNKDIGKYHPDFVHLVVATPDKEVHMTPELIEPVSSLHITVTEAEHILRADPSINFKELLEKKDFKTVTHLLTQHVDTWKGLQPIVAAHEGELEEIGWEHVLTLYSRSDTKMPKQEGQTMKFEWYEKPRGTLSDKPLNDLLAVHADPDSALQLFRQLKESRDPDTNWMEVSIMEVHDQPEFRHVPQIAYHYAHEKLMRKFGIQRNDRPPFILGHQGMHYNKSSNTVGCQRNEIIQSLYSNLSEELAHYLREKLWKETHPQDNESKPYDLSHEFFGFLGKRILLRALQNTEARNLFFAPDAETRYTTWNRENFKLEKTSSSWKRARRHLKTTGQYTKDAIENRRRGIQYLDTQGNYFDVQSFNRSFETMRHIRGYKYAIRFPEEALDTVDLKAMFSLTDEDVRHRFFTDKPNFDGLYKEDSRGAGS